MRIPLDYYRILGLPIQATAEQLQQAYRDRALQLPRREYTDAAIAARKHLLDRAYAVLLDPEQRSSYDASFLDQSYIKQSALGPETSSAGNGKPTEGDIDPYNPSLEISNQEFVGALLILQELGEYEQVLKLSRPYLSGGNKSQVLDNGSFGEPVLVRPDIVLTTALACLELGREQWQQAQYENAAASLETGQKLLLSEGLFPSVRGEIQADVYKLRPYRILELVALPESNVAQRRQGLQLLQYMLQERAGIDGTGEDQSGLSIDDFLRFIQQLRSYLTAAEQQHLFEAEAKRPSAVATYLAVYALMARGFAERQPGLIAAAKQMLMRLGRRQDVHLEQAVCALLLGQTEEASRALELSQEYEALAFIREHSQDSPDLLPGLCLYGERWLQTDVFPHFLDLASQQVSLKNYFADEQVQAYLENMPAGEGTANEWAVVESARRTNPATATSSGLSTPSEWSRSSTQREPQQHYGREQQTSSRGNALSQEERGNYEFSSKGEPVAATVARTMTATVTATESSFSANAQTITSSPEAESRTTSFARESSPNRRRRSSRHREQTSGALVSRNSMTKSLPPALPEGGSSTADPFSSRVHRTSAKVKSSPKSKRLILLAAVGLAGVGILAIIIFAVFKAVFHHSSVPGLKGEQLMVQLDQPPVPIPTPNSPKSAAEATLTEETAQQVIQTWLSGKAQAMGPEHKSDRLEQILADPALSVWQKRAEAAQKNNSYWHYKHSIEVKSVNKSDSNPEQASVEATVNEVAQLYERGKLNKSSSYDDNLQVRYDLIRQDNKWLVRDMTILK